MVELQHPMAEAGSVFERPGGVVELREIHPREVAVVSLRVAPDGIAAAIGGAFGEIVEAMEQAGVAIVGPPFSRYLSMGPEFEAEAGFPVLRPAPDIGRVHPGRLPGGRVASIVHVGPYDALATTYGLLMARLDELGLAPAGPMWEIYWSDPQAEPDPATWRTEVIQPVA